MIFASGIGYTVAVCVPKGRRPDADHAYFLSAPHLALATDPTAGEERCLLRLSGVTRQEDRADRQHKYGDGDINPEETILASLSMKELLEAGVHFGHQTRRWNPKMKRYIYGARNGIYIIDLHQTLKLFDDAQKFVQEVIQGGGRVLFVGTKKQAQDAIQEAA